MSLRGIILRDEGAELVIQATPAEVRAFTQGGRDVFVSRGRKSMSMVAAGQIARTGGAGHGLSLHLTPGDVLHTIDGDPVCIVQDINIESERLDTTSFGDVYRTYQAGPLRVNIRCYGL